MQPVAIIGIGQAPVGEHWTRSLQELAAEAVLAARTSAGQPAIDALYVGNMLSGALQQQRNLGAVVADAVGLRGVEALHVEAACASGAAALRQAYLGVASGAHKVAVALGVEKMTDATSDVVAGHLASAADAGHESIHGASFVALNALLQQRYCQTYGVEQAAFAAFACNAHANAAHNPNACFRQPITREQWRQAPQLATPIGLLDACSMADGAAAVVLCPLDQARQWTQQPIVIAGSAVATDSVALHDRKDLLWLAAVEQSAQKAYAQAGCTPADVDFAELHDAFGIMTALSLEANGFAPRGQATALAADGTFLPAGKLPISTQGGLKARGHPVGATGIYQAVEAVQQLQDAAGKNQVANARTALIQNLGGSAATAITHILKRVD